jgi:hypothetical protein
LAAAVEAATDVDADRLFHRSRDTFVILPALKNEESAAKNLLHSSSARSLWVEILRRYAPQNDGMTALTGPRWRRISVINASILL